MFPADGTRALNSFATPLTNAMTYRKKWVAGLALVLLAGLMVQQGIPLLFRWSPIRRVLRARLEYAFGRPVDVRSFDLSLVRGLRLEANTITVAEDPRFGQEFFLRAESLTAGLDWLALLRGRLRFARFTFTRPSLNVVVAGDGAWNVESWLESRASAGNAAARGAAAPERPRQIVVRTGRINFKRGVDKQPFALVGLDGTLAPEDDGVWRMEFEAHLLRAGVALQEAGTLRFLGRLPEAGALAPARPAGTSPVTAPPAQFDIVWQRASLSDVLRLVAGEDYGVRGSLEGNLFVRGPAAAPLAESTPADEVSAPPAADARMWSFRAALRLGGIHRWDLPLRLDHPAVNLAVEGMVAADRSRLELTKVSLEAPRSSLHSSGVFARDRPEETHFRFLSSSIHFDDLFAWYRAFHPGVAGGVAVDGYLGVDVEVARWPLRIERGALATDGARVAVPGVKKGFELSRAALRMTPKGTELSPLTLSLGDATGNFRLSASSLTGPGSHVQAVLTGETDRVEELFAAAAALGLTRAQGWRAEGAVRARLRWQGTAAPLHLAPSGTLDFEDVNFRAGALALPVHVARAHLEMNAAEHRVRISSAEFLGAQWNGALSAKTFAGPWSFSLAADHLDTAEFDRWFPPFASPGLLESALPGEDLDAGKIAWPEAFAAKGQLTAGEFAIGRLHLRKLKAAAAVANRRLELSPAEAELYGGRVRGSFRGSFNGTPRYDVDARFERVDLASLTTVGRTFRDCCSGVGSARINFTAGGVGHDALLKSLKGEGTADFKGAVLYSIDLPKSRDAGAFRDGTTKLRDVMGHFTIDAPQIFFDDILLDYGQKGDRVTGYVSFIGALSLTLHQVVRLPGDPPDAPHGREFRITGTLGAPQIAPKP